MRIAADSELGALIEGDQRELRDLAGALLEAAVLDDVTEYTLGEGGVYPVRIRRIEETE